MIHLKHKINGFHIVYTEADAKAAEKKGWKRCDMEKEHEKARKAKEKARKDLEEKAALNKAVAARVNDDLTTTD